MALRSRTDPTKWIHYACDTVWVYVQHCSIFAVLKEEVRICFVNFAKMIWVNDKEMDKESPIIQMKGVGRSVSAPLPQALRAEIS